MIDASMACLWIGTICLMLITTFHIALIIRRKSEITVYQQEENDYP